MPKPTKLPIHMIMSRQAIQAARLLVEGENRNATGAARERRETTWNRLRTLEQHHANSVDPAYYAAHAQVINDILEILEREGIQIDRFPENPYASRFVTQA